MVFTREYYFEVLIKVTVILFLAQTLFEAWQSSALSSAYLQKQLNEFSGQMSQLEAEVIAPKNWRASWDRYDTFCLQSRDFLTHHHLTTSKCVSVAS